MSLEIRQTFAQQLVLRHGLEGRFIDSVVPETTDALESGDYDDVLRMVRDLDVLGHDVEWRSVTDWFLCLVIPSEREACVRYYRDEGPRFKDIYGLTVLRAMDVFLLRQLEAMEAGLSLEEAMRDV